MTVVLLALTMFPAATGAIASDLPAELLNCSEISDRNQRLACYDDLASDFEGSEPDEPSDDRATDISGWKITREISAIDDSELVYLSLVAEVVTPEAPGRTLPTLFIRCKEGRVESFVNWGTPVGTGTVAVTIRFDEEEARTSDWIVSTDFAGTFVKGSHSAFIGKLRTHDRLVARLTPLAKNETTAIFNLVGLPEVISEIYQACIR